MEPIRLAGCLAAFALLASPAARAQNVLLVVADDLGADQVGLYTPDADTPPTPTLDALAASGVRFENAWAMPTCSPTRATLLTGRYPSRHGVGFALPFGSTLPDEELTIADVQQRAAQVGGPDIASLAAGKWHLAAALGQRVDPIRRGFDAFDGNNLGALGAPFSFEQWPRTIAEAGSAPTTTISEEYATSVQVDAARDWIADQTEPWFCYLAFHTPHTPFHAPPSELHGVDLTGLDPGEDPIPFYRAMVESMDTELGRLLDSIDPAVLAETTILVVGDNGSTGDVVVEPFDPARSKGSLYRNGVRVPLIASGAQIASPGREVSALVDVSDLFATVLELGGVDWQELVPADRPIDSVSLLPYLTQPFAVPQREWIAAQSEFPLAAAFPGTGVGLAALTSGTDLFAGAVPSSGTTVRNGGFKLIRNDNGIEELYRLATDPNEEQNLLVLPFLIGAAAQAYDELSAVIDGLAGVDG